MGDSTSLERTAWLFTRGELSVTMRVRDDAGELALDINGPGSASATHLFTQRPAMMAFAEAHQQQLLDAGFQLHAVVDRRGGGDRDRAARSGTSERRRSSS